MKQFNDKLLNEMVNVDSVGLPVMPEVEFLICCFVVPCFKF